MGANNMLILPVYLEAQPAMGAKPELHLKEGMGAVNVDLYILDRTGLTNVLAKRCVVKAVLPDGSKLFFTAFTTAEWGKFRIRIGTANVRKMCEVPGTYDCTVSILNTGSASVNANNYMEYDMLTVLPFRVIVSEAARRGEDA